HTCTTRSTLTSLHTTPTYNFASFFFQSYAAHRDLHSFPTRRSSDLFDQIINHAGRIRTRTRGRLHVPMVLSAPSGGGIHAPEHRSEEHTSELQSRENLVCRLLLEKKKNKKMIHIITRQK